MEDVLLVLLLMKMKLSYFSHIEINFWKLMILELIRLSKLLGSQVKKAIALLCLNTLGKVSVGYLISGKVCILH